VPQFRPWGARARIAGTKQEGTRMGHIDPTKEIFAQFRDNDRPGPIHMLNLVRLRKEAAYPDGRKASGAEAYAAYGRESGPVFERLGGRLGISSDWIAGRCAPTQITTPTIAIAPHRPSTAPQ